MPHEKRIEIRWRDLDSYGHVNQAVYLTFAEEVLDDWFRSELGRDPGTVWDYVARRTTIDYRGELRLSDRLAVGSAELVAAGHDERHREGDAERSRRARRDRARARGRRDRRQGWRAAAAHRARAGGSVVLARDCERVSYWISVSSLNIGRYIEMITMPTMIPTPSIMIGSTIEVSDWIEASTSSS